MIEIEHNELNRLFSDKSKNLIFNNCRYSKTNTVKILKNYYNTQKCIQYLCLILFSYKINTILF